MADEVRAAAYELTGKFPRQGSPDLITALKQAVSHFRMEAQSYRSQCHPNKHRMDKNVRRALAATNEDWARAIEKHIDAITALRS